MFDPGPSSDNSTRMLARKQRPMPRWTVWKISNVQRLAISLTEWGICDNGDGSAPSPNRLWLYIVASHFGCNVLISSKSKPICPAMHLWQTPTGGLLRVLCFCTCRKERINPPLSVNHGQSPQMRSTAMWNLPRPCIPSAIPVPNMNFASSAAEHMSASHTCSCLPVYSTFGSAANRNLDVKVCPM